MDSHLNTSHDLENITSVFMTFTANCYLYKQKSPDPLLRKDEKIPAGFDSTLKTCNHANTAGNTHNLAIDPQNYRKLRYAEQCF